MSDNDNIDMRLDAEAAQRLVGTVAQIVKDEREACAKLIEDQTDKGLSFKQLADLIRARKT
jgi:hypothetical protein